MADLTPAFVDTAYVFALINTRDRWHARAAPWEETLSRQRRRLLTSQFVLIEIADGLSALSFRQRAVAALDALSGSSLLEIVSASPQLYHDAFELYRNRRDKEWGLTDCSSFVIMQRRGLHDALTTDQHFVQAGFRALLINEP